MYLSNHQLNFKYSNCVIHKKDNKFYIQLQLILSLGKKRFAFGRENNANYQKMIEAGIAIDKYIDLCLSEDRVMDYQELNTIVKSIAKPHLVVVKAVDLKTIWQDYLDYHNSLGCWSESYIHTHLQTIGNLINRSDFPQDLSKPTLALEYLLKGKRSVKTARDRFKLIVAAIDWGSKHDKLDRKLGVKWRDCLSTINSKLKTERKKSDREQSGNEEEYIDPFSVLEIEQILDALLNETHSRYKGRHYQYYHYVSFLWLTGCRPSEAIALKWNNVSLLKKKIKFCEAEVMASGKLCKRSGTKTEPFRFFPVNADLESLFAQLPQRSKYVFTAYDGSPIAQHNFSRVWKLLLKNLGIRHRIPYQLRHSMISYHANRGFPLPQLAKIVGNSEKVIREHYLAIDYSLINVPTIE